MKGEHAGVVTTLDHEETRSDKRADKSLGRKKKKKEKKKEEQKSRWRCSCDE